MLKKILFLSIMTVSSLTYSVESNTVNDCSKKIIHDMIKKNISKRYITTHTQSKRDDTNVELKKNAVIIESSYITLDQINIKCKKTVQGN
jgi:hypothetical protein